MKRLLLIVALLLLGSGWANAQCVPGPSDPCVSVNQSILDRTSKGLTELAALRDAVAKYAAERTATDAERAAAKSVIEAGNNAISMLQKGIADRDTIIALQQKTMELYAQLVEKLQAQINKPKSGWQKFAATLEKVALVLAGAALRGGL